jgi:8-oxo-dGTP diphosphatase
MTGFTGAKLALVCGDDVLVYLRDDVPGLPWAGYWDLPGGGREGDESPLACALRELEEEFGLTLPDARISAPHDYPDWRHSPQRAYFFAGQITADEIASIRFGNEGQRWCMMPIQAFLTHPQAVPHLQSRLRDWLVASGQF